MKAMAIRTREFEFEPEGISIGSQGISIGSSVRLPFFYSLLWCCGMNSAVDGKPGSACRDVFTGAAHKSQTSVPGFEISPTRSQS
jgi:hypothetical protein